MGSNPTPSASDAPGAEAAASALPPGSRARDTALVVVLCALLWAPFVLRGWIPHDEGTLAQSATRVLAGELPHRDFDEGYTGLVSLFHAALFAVFGAALPTLRWTLFVAALGFAATLFALARRMASRPLALAATFTAALWSLPLYFSAMPSWYLLFASTASLWALVRYFESRHRAWLSAAGAAAALAFLCKSTGLVALAAGALALLFDAQEDEPGDPAAAPAGGRGFAWLVTLGGALAVAALAVLVAADGSAMAYLHFVLPPAAVVAYLVRGEWRRASSPFTSRARGLLRRWLPFGLGAAAPVALFTAYFAFRDGLAAWAESLLARPSLQISFSSMALPPLESLAAAAPAAFLLLLGSRLPARARWPAALLLGAGLAAALPFGGRPVVYSAVWASLRPLVPIVTLAGLLALAGPRQRLGALRRQSLFALVAFTALVSLVQFPYSFGIYFAYVAPLLAVTAVATVASNPALPRAAPAVLLTFYVLFAAAWESRNGIQLRGGRYETYRPVARFELPPARGLLVPRGSRQQYETLALEVAKHVPAGGWLWAGPDCPEVHFLTSTRNPTRTLLDFSDPDFADPPRRARRILARLEALDVRAAVVARVAPFSGRIDETLAQGLRERFPQSVAIGKFVVLWRQDERSPPSIGGGAAGGEPARIPSREPAD